MTRRKKKKVLIVSASILVLAIAVVFLFVSMAPVPPLEKIDQARIAISEAKKVRADAYAPTLFLESEKLYQSAISKWKAENTKFILKRDFSAIGAIVDLSLTKAKDAKNKALTHSSDLQTSLGATIKTLSRSVEKYDDLFSQLPLRKKVVQDYEKGKMLLNEAKYDYKSKSYLVCKKKIDNSSKYLNDSFSLVKSYLKDYFTNYSSWIEWNNSTVNSSKSNKSDAIVVDKYAKKCYIYKSGKLKHTFDVELGKNWIGTKLYKGDKATPEGIYHVTKKLQGKRTKYYKALMINYPNDKDKSRFDQEKKRGNLSNRAQIGGLIEIHGGGGMGVNWTEGCIALRDCDMEIVFREINEGSTVTIVGSLIKLSELVEF
jgi:L,D-peptidoglycan transpeptidase YkuD (ErfK/YbiS/YcfS/YnhG family)